MLYPVYYDIDGYMEVYAKALSKYDQFTEESVTIDAMLDKNADIWIDLHDVVRAIFPKDFDAVMQELKDLEKAGKIRFLKSTNPRWRPDSYMHIDDMEIVKPVLLKTEHPDTTDLGYRFDMLYQCKAIAEKGKACILAEFGVEPNLTITEIAQRAWKYSRKWRTTALRLFEKYGYEIPQELFDRYEFIRKKPGKPARPNIPEDKLIEQLKNEFLPEILQISSWTQLQLTFLYQVYRAWSQQNYPNQRIVDESPFKKAIRAIFTENTRIKNWELTKQKTSKRRTNSLNSLQMKYKIDNYQRPESNMPSECLIKRYK